MLVNGLTNTRLSVSWLIAQGHQDGYILEQTGMSQAELRELLKELFCEFGVRSRVELILYAYAEPARSKGGVDRIPCALMEQDDAGTAQKATLSDATARGSQGSKR